MQTWQCPIDNGTLETLIKHVKDISAFLGLKVFSLIIPKWFTGVEMRRSLLRNTNTENNQFLNLSTLIFNVYLTRKSFSGDSGIAIFS